MERSGEAHPVVPARLQDHPGDLALAREPGCELLEAGAVRAEAQNLALGLELASRQIAAMWARLPTSMPIVFTRATSLKFLTPGSSLSSSHEC